MNVKRYDMEKEYSLDIVIIPVEEADGAFVHYDDYASLQKINNELLEALHNMVEAYQYEASVDNPALLAARAAIAKALGESK